MTTLYSLLERHLEIGRDRPLLVTSDRTYTSAELRDESSRIAAWLRAAGLTRGDRVVIDLKNGATAVAALFGVSRVGGIVVGATPQWTPAQLAHVISDSGAQFLITNELRVKQLGQNLPPHVLVDGACEGATSVAALSETWDGHVPPAPSDPAILVYTSGSTGAPKGVVHPHRNLVDFARIVSGYLQNDADDRLLWVLGWSFGYGLSQLLTMCFVGGCLIVPASMLPADIVKAHDVHAATGLAQVPFGWGQLIAFLEKTNRTLTGLRYVTNAGDGPSPNMLERLPKVVPGAEIILMYGQTECLRTTYLPGPRFDEKRGAMGYPIPGVEVFVVDPDGRACPPNEPGELLHRGALLFAGYWNAPVPTRDKLRPAPALRELIGDEPVLHTGDVVRRDEDGCLWYVGRSERMIKSSGFRFGPSEIEACLRADPSVVDAVVYGVDDAALGQAVEAAVVTSAAVAEAVLLDAVRRRLPRYMIPRRIHFVDEIPRNGRGKVELRALREIGARAAR